MTAVSHHQQSATPADIRVQTQALWDANRLRCGWFLRDNFCPETPEELAQCLRLLARYGDRATFVQARKLQRCRIFKN